MFKRRAGRVAWRLLVYSTAACFVWTSTAYEIAKAQQANHNEAEWHAARDQVAANFRLLREYRASLDVTGIDPAAKAAQIGPSIEALFAFVRDEIGLHPYRGAQRFAAGTLMSGAGSACDKALLLGAMLRAQGHTTVRYARATLDEAAAQQRLAEVEAVPALEHALAPLLRDDPALEDLQLRLGISADEIAEDRDAATVWQEALLDALGWGFRRNYDLIRAKLLEAGVTIGGVANPDAARLIDNLRDHCWVQVQQDGAWVDLDPSLGANKPGDRPAEPQSVTEALPDELATRIKIAVTIERREGDAIKTDQVLETTETLDAAVNELQLAVVPESWSGALAKTFETSNQLETLGALWPVVWLNGRATPGHPFDLKGAVLADDPAMRAVAAQGEKTGETITIFGTKIQGATAPAAPSVLSGVTVEFTLLRPDGQTKSWTRNFARFSGDDTSFRVNLLQPMSLVASASRVDRRYVDVRMIDHVLANRQLVIAAIDASHDQVTPNSEQLLEGAQALPSPLLLDLVTMRGTLLDYLTAFHATGVLAYPDGPFIAAWHQQFVTGPEARAEAGIDIMANSLTVVDLAAAIAGDRSVAMRMTQGVTDTVLEYLLLGGGDAINAHSVAYSAEVDDVPFRVLKPGEAPPPDLGDAIARASMARDLQAGFAIVVPSRPVTLGGREALAWWRIDPKTGATLGVGAEGTGTATETAILVAKHIAIASVVCLAGHYGASAVSGDWAPPTLGQMAFCVALYFAIWGVGHYLNKALTAVAGGAAGGAGGAMGGKGGGSPKPPTAPGAPKTPTAGGGKGVTPKPNWLPEPIPAKGGSGGKGGGGGGEVAPVKGSPPKPPVKEAYNPIEPPGPPGPKPKKPFDPRKGGEYEGLKPGKGEPSKGEPTKGEPSKGEPGKGGKPGEKAEAGKQPFDPKKGGEYEGLKPGKGEPGKGEPSKGEPGKGEPSKGEKPGEKTEVGKEPPTGSDLMTDAQRRLARKAGEDAASWKRNPPLTAQDTKGMRNNAEVQAIKGQDLQAVEAGLGYGKNVPIEEVMRTTGLSREQAKDALKRYVRNAFGETNESRLQNMADEWASGKSTPPGMTTGASGSPSDPFTGAKPGTETQDIPPPGDDALWKYFE